MIVLHYLAAAQLSAGEFGDAIKSYKKIVKLYQQEEDPPYSLIANGWMTCFLNYNMVDQFTMSFFV